MENATRAFIIVAGILLGVLLLSLGIYLFSIFSQYSADAYKTMEQNQVAQFNSQFLKYYGKISRAYTDEDGKEKTVEEPIKCTAHDIISIANLAQQNNIQFQVQDEQHYSEQTRYIQVDIGTQKKDKNIEKWEETKKIEFLKENATETYECTAVLTSSVTNRVYYIQFKKIENP